MKIIIIAFALIIASANAENRKNLTSTTTTTTTQSTTTTTPCVKEHEVFNNCGTACPLSCDVPFVESCTKQCVVGCFCETGYVRDSNGNCILPSQCPKPSCKNDHEVYSDCGPTSDCEISCDRPTGSFVCPGKCVAGCFCDFGYVRGPNGDCILKEECPSPAPSCTLEHEYYTDCGTACPLSCAVPSVEFCTLQCVPGCFCEDGYVRDDNGNCILPQDCSNQGCSENEVFSNCFISECQNSCINPNLFDECSESCTPGCVCIEGYVRDLDGRCIRLDQCPRCPKPHENYSDCGTACELTCDAPSVEFCTEQCVAGCFCDEGYIRDRNNDCILPEDCPPVICPPREIYSKCEANPDCQNTCALPRASEVCFPECIPGCICQKGYVRSANGTCLTLDECAEIAVCGPNQVYEKCTSICGEKNCVFPRDRICGIGCAGKCLCKEGYIRDRTRENCILIEDCPPN